MTTEEKDILPFTEYAAGNRGRWTIPPEIIPDIKKYICKYREEGFIIKEIADALNISSELIRRWLSDDSDFRALYDAAELHITDTLEKEAIRRARDGILEPVISNGRVVMDPRDATKPLLIRKYSDDLLKFTLKGRRREVYGDRVETDNRHDFTTDGALDELKSIIAAANKPTPTG